MQTTPGKLFPKTGRAALGGIRTHDTLSALPTEPPRLHSWLGLKSSKQHNTKANLPMQVCNWSYHLLGNKETQDSLYSRRTASEGQCTTTAGCTSATVLYRTDKNHISKLKERILVKQEIQPKFCFGVLSKQQVSSNATILEDQPKRWHYILDHPSIANDLFLQIAIG